MEAPFGRVRQKNQTTKQEQENNKMNASIRRKKDMLTRVAQYVQDHAITPPIARATALFTEVNTLKTALGAQDGTQAIGKGGYRASASERAVLAKDLRAYLADMAATGRGLNRTHPGMADQFRMARSANSHTKLVTKGREFLAVATEAAVKPLFTARAFDADFDVTLTAKIDALEAALSRTATGKQEWKEGTERLKALSLQITDVMKELRALMGKHLRETDPALLNVWKAAAPSYAPPAPAGPPVDGGSGGSGSGSTPPPVLPPA